MGTEKARYDVYRPGIDGWEVWWNLPANYLTIQYCPCTEAYPVSKVELFGIRITRRVWFATWAVDIWNHSGRSGQRNQEQNIEITPVYWEKTWWNFQYNVIYKGKYTTRRNTRRIILSVKTAKEVWSISGHRKNRIGCLAVQSSAKAKTTIAGFVFMVYQTSGSNGMISDKFRNCLRRSRANYHRHAVCHPFSSKASLDALSIR